MLPWSYKYQNGNGWKRSHECRTTVMVDFMRQFDWATEYQDIWLNIILGMSMRVFLHEINIWIRRLYKTDCPPQCGGPHPICWRPEWNKKLSKKEFFLSACLSAKTLLFSYLWTQTWTKPTSSPVLVLRPSDSDWNYTIGSPGSGLLILVWVNAI